MDLDVAVSTLKGELRNNSKMLQVEEEVVQKFGQLFRYDNIENISAQEFQSFLDFKENHHWTLSRLKTTLTRDMLKLRAALKILLNESSPLEERLQRLRDPHSQDYKEYMGRAIFSPILLVTNPDKYPVYNGTVERAFEKIGIKLENEPRPIWKSYPEVQKVILNLASKYELSLWQIDSVWWKVVGSISYSDLVKYLNENPMQENYQPVVIKILTDNASGITRQVIEEQLNNHNPDSTSKSMTNTVLSVLKHNDIIRQEEDEYVLNLSKELSEEEANTIRSLCDQKIKELSSNQSQIRYWKVAPGGNASMWEESRVNKFIAIGWNELGNLSDRSLDEIGEDLKRQHPDSYIAIMNQFKNFLSIKEGDIIIANKGYSKIVGMGTVKGPYKYRPDLTLHQTYPVEWFDTKERDIPPQTGVWRKTVSPVDADLYNKIISGTWEKYLILRHQPDFKRDKNERTYWNDLLGKEYHFGKNVPNFKKVSAGTKTVWFYTDNMDLYLWGYGEVDTVKGLGDDKFIATYNSFHLFDNSGSAIKATDSVQEKIKSLDSWSPYNSIIEVNQEIYEDIIRIANQNEKREPIKEDEEEGNNYAINETKTKILERSIYLTGYDNLNLQRSKEYQILGWKDRPSKLFTGDYVFVFNTTGDKIESCFEIKSLSSNKNPIWHEESSYGDNGSQPLELVYPYRWDADLIADRLDINKDTIFKFEPFSSDKKNFSMLLRNRHPRSLDNSQYTKFTTFLLDKIQTRAAKDDREKQESLQEQLPKKDLIIFDDEKLPELTIQDIKKGCQKVSEELLISEDKVIEIVTALASGRHVLLAGPIGTGKTHLAKMIPEIFWESMGGYIAEEHTATADWSTQDVIGGIMPKMKNDKVVYEIQYGCAVNTIQKNWQHGSGSDGRRIEVRSSTRDTPYRGVWLVIDEFNRADIDKSFGELFTALRTRSLKIPTGEIGYSYRNLQIPEDYRIIGTLNTADKHFLFGLSDALKSRFAYIEVDIPSKEDYDEEIYYAMKNAISELKLSNSDTLVSIDSQNKKIGEGTSNQEFYNRAYQAYHFLDCVRLFKKLGTAILQSIYQNMLVTTRITGDTKMALDNSLTSTLVPQLEGLPQSEIGTIAALFGDNLVQFFRSAYKSPNRQSYSRAFSKTLQFLKVPNREGLYKEFVNGLLRGEDDNTWWMPIDSAYAATNRFELGLNRLKHATDDLIESAIL